MAKKQHQQQRRLVVFTGAGVSAESGLRTFRDSGGLWEGHRVEEVATPQAWQRNPGLVLEFYNQRRRDLLSAEPNAAHLAIADLERDFLVDVITQNVDDLHERAGSTRVLHLHGELMKARSTEDDDYVVSLTGSELSLGDRCPLGSQLRPHIVWFGEEVPMMEEAVSVVQSADLFAVVGSSLAVYPAAGLLEYVREGVPRFLVDPNPPARVDSAGIAIISKPASSGVAELVARLRAAPARLP